MLEENVDLALEENMELAEDFLYERYGTLVELGSGIQGSVYRPLTRPDMAIKVIPLYGEVDQTQWYGKQEGAIIDNQLVLDGSFVKLGSNARQNLVHALREKVT